MSTWHVTSASKGWQRTMMYPSGYDAVFPKYIKILRKFSKGLVPKIKFCLFFNTVRFGMRNWRSLILKKFILVLNFD